jgi:hypothetical protein
VKQQKQQEQGKKQQLKQEGVSSNVYVDCGDLVICKVFFIPFFFSLVNDESIRKGLLMNIICFNFVFSFSTYEKEKGNHSGFQRQKVCLHLGVLPQGWQGTSFQEMQAQSSLSEKLYCA